MKKFLASILIIVMVLCAAVFFGPEPTPAVDLSGFVKLGYAIDSSVDTTGDNIKAGLDISTDYIFDSGVRAQINNDFSVAAGISSVEDIDTVYKFSAEHVITGPFSVELSHTDTDSKISADHDQTVVSGVLRFD